jgi:uncharacterized protein (TIGR00369 family)
VNDEHRRMVASGEHLFAQLGLRDVDVASAELAIEMDLTPRVGNPRGALQGGLLATMVDIVAGRLAIQGLAEGLTVATSDLTIHYLAPVTVGPARAEGTVLRRGRRAVVVHVDIRDVGRDCLAAVSTVAFAVVGPAR